MNGCLTSCVRYCDVLLVVVIKYTFSSALETHPILAQCVRSMNIQLGIDDGVADADDLIDGSYVVDNSYEKII